MSGYFVPFHLQERRKLCNCTNVIEMEKCCERERMSWQEKEGGEEAGIKTRFHIGGMKFTLA